MAKRVRQTQTTASRADETDDVIDNIVADIARWPRPDAANVVFGIIRGLHSCVRHDVEFRQWPEGLAEALDLVVNEALGLPSQNPETDAERLRALCAVAQGASVDPESLQ